MKELWNQKYAVEQYHYGTEPNLFFASEITKLTKGKVLMPAEGEGRNAVFAAQQGWDVFAFDQSEEGRKKALRLAQQRGVEIIYRVESLDEFTTDQVFDCIVLIFAHFPPHLREGFHKKLLSFLKPGGVLLLEGFEKAQEQRTSGGPTKNPAMLFSKKELESDFAEMSELKVELVTEELDEGHGHRGEADLIRLVGIK